jgi:inorganic pyrophosphatase
MDFDVTVEIPKGQRNKYEVDHETGRIRLDRTLFTSTQYPADYGFIENTLGEDGDRSTRWSGAGAHVSGLPDPVPGHRHVPHARREGRRRQSALRPYDDPRLEHLRDIHHVPKFDRLEIQHFFEVYKELEPGKSVEGATWVGRTEAEAEIARSFKREEDRRSGSGEHRDV